MSRASTTEPEEGITTSEINGTAVAASQPSIPAETPKSEPLVKRNACTSPPPFAPFNSLTVLKSKS
jgi:hypothetical protein